MNRTAVKSGAVVGRRRLRFESLDEVREDVQGLVDAEQRGRLKQLGNWTLGQTFGHLSAWVDYSYTGPPFKPPFFIRWILRLRKHKFLHEPMPAGVRIPGVPGGTTATDPRPLPEATEAYTRSLERLKAEAPALPHLIFGHLPHQEWILINLRHAELHLSFFVPEDDVSRLS